MRIELVRSKSDEGLLGGEADFGEGADDDGLRIAPSLGARGVVA